MMMRRAMRPGRGIVGAVATTAVVAGTAGAVHHRQEQRWANQAAEQQAEQQAAEQQAMEQQMAELQAQQAAAAAAAPAAAAAAPASAGDELMAQLNQLAQLHQAGVLSDEEFAAAKAKLLA
jgi:microsomal dipeptidase-like Zn-dependent dipeptidase